LSDQGAHGGTQREAQPRARGRRESRLARGARPSTNWRLRVLFGSEATPCARCDPEVACEAQDGNQQRRFFEQRGGEAGKYAQANRSGASELARVGQTQEQRKEEGRRRLNIEWRKVRRARWADEHQMRPREDSQDRGSRKAKLGAKAMGHQRGGAHPKSALKNSEIFVRVKVLECREHRQADALAIGRGDPAMRITFERRIHPKVALPVPGKTLVKPGHRLSEPGHRKERERKEGGRRRKRGRVERRRRSGRIARAHLDASPQQEAQNPNRDAMGPRQREGCCGEERCERRGAGRQSSNVQCPFWREACEGKGGVVH
jgi:hypothetical protein